MKDQWDCVLNDLEELGDKGFLVLMDQYSIEIVSCSSLSSVSNKYEGTVSLECTWKKTSVVSE